MEVNGKKRILKIFARLQNGKKLIKKKWHRNIKYQQEVFSVIFRK